MVERGFNSLLDYYYLLKYDGESGDEWRRVMDALLVQETYFWWEIDQVRALVEVIVPQHFSRSPAEPLRIWSAACATGEEPLTTAFDFQEIGGAFVYVKQQAACELPRFKGRSPATESRG